MKKFCLMCQVSHRTLNENHFCSGCEGSFEIIQVLLDEDDTSQSSQGQPTLHFSEKQRLFEADDEKTLAELRLSQCKPETCNRLTCSCGLNLKSKKIHKSAALIHRNSAHEERPQTNADKIETDIEALSSYRRDAEITPVQARTELEISNPKDFICSNSQASTKEDEQMSIIQPKNELKISEIQSSATNITLNSTPTLQDSISKQSSHPFQDLTCQNQIFDDQRVQFLLEDDQSKNESVELMIVLEEDNELVSENLLNNSQDFDIRGPMAQMSLDPASRGLIKYERNTIRVGKQYQAKIPQLLSRSKNFPSPREYRLKFAPSLIKSNDLAALEAVLIQRFGMSNLSTEKLAFWLKELQYNMPNLCSQVLQNGKQAKKRLEFRRPRELKYGYHLYVSFKLENQNLKINNTSPLVETDIVSFRDRLSRKIKYPLERCLRDQLQLLGKKLDKILLKKQHDKKARITRRQEQLVF